MINIRKRGNNYQCCFEAGKVNGKRIYIEMVFTRKDGTYLGTDIIKYPFKIIHHELGINC